MSQYNAITLPSRAMTPAVAGPAVQRESPEVLFVLRRYRRLMALGVILGALIGFGVYKYMRKYYPGYTAKCWFHVRPRSQNPFGLGGGMIGGISHEGLFYQAQLYRSPYILSTALKAPAFQTDYRQPNNPALKSQWFMKHESNPIHALRKALYVLPSRRSGIFRVGLTTGDPRQSRQMLRAIDTVYLRIVRNTEYDQQTTRARKLAAAIAARKRTIRAKQRELESYRVRHDVPGMIEQKGFIAQALGQLKTMQIVSEMRALRARKSYESIKKQVNTNTLQLSADMEQFIDNDPGLRDLQAVKLQLEQQLAVETATLGQDNRATRALQVRIAEVNRQVRKLRDKLRARARLMMQQNAKSRMKAAQSNEQETRHKFDEQQRRVKDLDRFVAQFETREASIRSDQRQLNHWKAEYAVMGVGQKTQSPRVVLSQPPTVSPKPNYPKFLDYMIGGPLIGLVFMFGLGYLLELTNTRVRTPRDITGTMQLPLLGWVPDQEDDGVVNGDLMTSVRTSPASMIAESFRQIRGRLAAQSNGKPLNSILVASLSPGGGATTVASNLANSIALNDLRVLLVDVNFYRPGLHNVYPNVPTVGLSDVVGKQATLEDAIVPSPDLPSLHILGAGTVTRAPGELPESKAFRDVLVELRNRYDLVIFDGAPLSIVSDSLNLASKVDGVIAVARAGAITRGTVGRIRDQLRQVNATLLGIVLNAAQTHGSGYFKKNYRDFYEYAAGAPQPKRTMQKSGH